MAQAGILTHRQGKIVGSNSGLALLSGYRQTELPGKHVLELVAPQSRALVQTKLRSPDEDPYQIWGLKKDGTTFPVTIQGMQLGARADSMRVVVAQQVDQKRTLSQESCCFHERDYECLTTVIHHLRSPLTTMYMALRMIRLIPSPEKQQSYFDLVMRECEQEISLLDDWLDIEKLRAQQYRLSYKPINLNFWLPDMIAGFEVRAQQRQQILRLDVPSPLPLLTTDLTSLDRILQELLNNASKYSAVGSQIFLQVELVDQGFRFSVSNPAQIPKEALPHLWEKFYRVPQGDLHQQGGTGLGLTLVKMMVEQLQGSITVTSNAGCTTFSLWIPNLTL